MEMEKSNNVTNHPSYYNQYPIEVIDMMERIFGLENTELWCVMTAFKYRMRMGHKDDIQQDMEKEQWYLRRAESLRYRQKNIASENISAEAKLRAISEVYRTTSDVQAFFAELKRIL
jgi:selenocysteine lyase/cysteine desulfurase